MDNDRRAVIALAALICWLALASSADAQTILGGVVRDPTGQVAPDVTVVAENEDTGDIWETRSSSLGLYAFYRLPSGTYTLRVNLPPLSFLKTGIQVRPRHKTAHDIPLRIGREEHVTVRSSSAFPRPLSDGSIGAAFSREAIEGMPKSNGENLQSILTVIPGIVFTELVTGSLAQFTTLGQRRFSNRLTIDGVSADLGIDVGAIGISQSGSGTLPAFATSGGTQTLIPMSAIDEIEVRTSNASSEHARAPGAQTVIVTKSGSDRLKASSFMNVRPDALAATEWFVNAGRSPRGLRRYWDGGLSLGGPLLPKRLFYFGTWERQHIDRSQATTVNVPSLSLRDELAGLPGASVLLPLVDAYPRPNGKEWSGGLAELTERFPALTDSDTINLRLDANLSSNHRSFLRVNRGHSTGSSFGAFVAAYAHTDIESTSTTTATTGHTSTWNAVSHELRLSSAIHHGSLTSGPARFGGAKPLSVDGLVAPGVSETDAWISVVFLGVDGGFIRSGRYGANSQKQVQVADTWSFSTGRHEWRLGFEYYQMTASSSPASHRYIYRFSNGTAEFVDGMARVVQIQDLKPAGARREIWSVFAQDTFRISPRLSLNYGLRYGVKPAPFSRTELHPLVVDFETLEPNRQPIPRGGPLWNTSWTDLAPRIATVYHAGTTAGRETTIRAGWSLVFDERSSAGARPFGGGYPYVSSRSLFDAPFPVPAESLVVAQPAPFAPGDFATYFSFPQDLRSPRMHEWQVAIDRALGRTQQLSVAYVGAAGRDLLYWHSYDVGQPMVQAYSNEARSDYHALLIEYVRRRSRRFQGRLSYTWSHAIDNDSGEATRPYAPPKIIAPSSNGASADFDRRHVLRVVGSYQLPGPLGPRWLQPLLQDWQVDGVLTAQSGPPVSIVFPKTFVFGNYLVRPDIVDGEPIWLADPASPGGRRINLAAFEAPQKSIQGNLGRNALRGSPLRQIDVSLSRSLRVGQRMVVQLRLEAFNVFNTPNFGPPIATFGVSNFGAPDRSYAETLGTGTLEGGGLVPLQQTGGARSLQFGLRLWY